MLGVLLLIRIREDWSLAAVFYWWLGRFLLGSLFLCLDFFHLLKRGQVIFDLVIFSPLFGCSLFLRTLVLIFLHLRDHMLANLYIRPLEL